MDTNYDDVITLRGEEPRDDVYNMASHYSFVNNEATGVGTHVYTIDKVPDVSIDITKDIREEPNRVGYYAVVPKGVIDAAMADVRGRLDALETTDLRAPLGQLTNIDGYNRCKRLVDPNMYPVKMATIGCVDSVHLPEDIKKINTTNNFEAAVKVRDAYIEAIAAKHKIGVLDKDKILLHGVANIKITFPTPKIDPTTSRYKPVYPSVIITHIELGSTLKFRK